jgi:nitroimidazol reductase NimA-like FMN-containing flavoprotein (pyridoxamine 5'-phosphate oxidase superfamily)
MRRQEREITENDKIENLLRQGKELHLALADGSKPYLVTVNYGYKDKALYFHCAREGRKLDILRKNPLVYFQIIPESKIIQGEPACRWTCKYSSVCGEAAAEIHNMHQQKRIGLQILMSQFGKADADFGENETKNFTVVKLNILSLSGKSSL